MKHKDEEWDDYWINLCQSQLKNINLRPLDLSSLKSSDFDQVESWEKYNNHQKRMMTRTIARVENFIFTIRQGRYWIERCRTPYHAKLKFNRKNQGYKCDLFKHLRYPVINDDLKLFCLMIRRKDEWRDIKAVK